MGKILQALAEEALCIKPTFYDDSHPSKKVLDAMCEAGDFLEETLNDEEKRFFEQFRDAQLEQSEQYANSQFIRGYRLGVLTMIEIFTESGGLIHRD